MFAKLIVCALDIGTGDATCAVGDAPYNTACGAGTTPADGGKCARGFSPYWPGACRSGVFPLIPP